jgi:small subunit ribosomal protein S8
MAKKTEVLIPYSKIKFNIAKLLEKEGWLAGVEVFDPSSSFKGRRRRLSSMFKQIICRLIYDENRQSKIRNLRRISKPGCRVYVKYSEIRPVCNGYGLGIISTSQGLLTDKEARKRRVGGEYICEIW